MNCGTIIGSDHNLDLMKNDKHLQMQNFLKNILSHKFIPCITRPTRIMKSIATLIDNIITSRNMFDTLTCGIAISDISDHFPCIMTWPKALSKIGANLAKNTVSSVTNVDTYLRKIPKNKMSIFLAPCSRTEIKKIILGLKQKKSSGYDKINNILL